MLSICVPIYNQSVRPLVEGVLPQIEACSEPVELLFMDDGSAPSWKAENELLLSSQHIRIIWLEANVGRARIRNLLAAEARYPYLLFLDGDSGIIQEDFLKKYLDAIRTGHKVMVGGRVYTDSLPEPEFGLHWRYGTSRESRKAEIRRQRPHDSFMTNNFVIEKALCQQIQFDEQIRTYGHEDTLFGFRLKEADIPIIHLDNPVLHLELVDTPTFLHKAELGVKNLFILMQSPEVPNSFAQGVQLSRIYYRLSKQKIFPFVRFLFILLNPLIRSFLIWQKGPVWLFNMYKLGYLLKQ